MRPEPLPRDRRDFRKPERCGSDPRLGGGWGPDRWREQQHHHPYAPPPYHQNHHHQQQPWYSDFRDPRLLPSGHGKQGGWHMYSDDAGPGFLPLGSRYADRNLGNENCRPFGSRAEGKYFRNNRENRGPFTPRDWKAPSWGERAASPSTPGKPITEVNNLRSLENTQPGHNSSSSRSSCASHLPPNSVNLSDQSQSQSPSQSLVMEKNDKNGGTADDMIGAGRDSDKENCLGSVDWKPVKWTRLGSLSSRGSCFSHSSSSKGVGLDSAEIMAEVQPKSAPIVQSPSADAAYVRSTGPAQSDETGSRKKPRLGWGEGLAKYEKKKVEGPEDDATKNQLVLSAINTETLQSQSVNLPEKSPRVAILSDCSSPATPSSVACSSSPGVEEKEFVKEANVDCDTTNLSCSTSIVPQTQYGGPSLNLENLELASIDNLSSSINELLQSNDPSSAETGYMRTTSMNKLLVWKVDILKALEMTESEIESLETELKSLMVEPTICCPHPAGSSSQPGEQQLKPCEGLVTASKCGIRIDPVQIDSSGEMIVENAHVGPESMHTLSKDEDIDSPGSATSRFVEVLPALYPSETADSIEGSRNLDVNKSSNLDEKCLKNGLSYEENSGCVDNHVLIGTTSNEDLASVSNLDCDIDNIYDTIFSSNRDAASRALEQLNKLLPKQRLCDSSTESSLSLQRGSSVVKEKFLMRKRFLQFKEKVLTLKFKVFQHFWKEGRAVSIRKLRVKKCDPSRNGHKRNHSSFRSRVSSYAGGPQVVPADEVIEYVNGLLSELAFKPYRDTLKMPALILDKELKMSRFISNNCLVEDPCAVEKERAMINPWTSEEKEIFVDKLAAFGKDFGKIGSFLDHKTVADCIEFYYKNHKSKCFEKTRKNPGLTKQRKSESTAYLVATRKRRNPELNAASLDILGAASEIVANIDDGMDVQQRCPSRLSFGASSSWRAPRGDDGLLQGSDGMNMYCNERETEAADVLASICGSLSSEAMGSCITSSVDPSDGYQDRRGLKISSSTKRSLTPEVTQDVDDECSDESFGELNPTDWSDEEKSLFIQAVSSYGKDFVMISESVRTRSIDQCKVFFSKARKCLGLDLSHPGAGTSSGDVNGEGSDVEDGCTVETGSVFCHNGSSCEMEGLPPTATKLNHESDMVGTQNLVPDMRLSNGNNGLCPLDSETAEPVSKNSSLIGSHGDDKPVIDFNVHSRGKRAIDVALVSVQELQTLVVSSNTESEQGIEEEDNLGMPNGSSEAENKALVEASDGYCGEENQQEGPSSREQNSENKKVEDRDANSSEVSDISSGINETKSEPQLAGTVSHPSVDAHSSIQVHEISGYQKKVDLENFSTEKSSVSSLHQNGHLASMMSSTLFSVPIRYQKTPNYKALLAVGANGISGTHSQEIVFTGDCQQHLPGYSSNSMESSPVLRGYPVSVETMKEANGDVCCEKLTALPNVPKRDGNLNSGRRTDFVLEKCNESRRESKVVEAPYPSLGQIKDHSRSQSGCSSAGDGPSMNGDVKLFGKILISSQQKPNNCAERADDNSSRDHKIGRESLNLKLSADQKVKFDSVRSIFDCNNYIGAENIRGRSFGYWDGNRIQTGIHALPDSVFLLNKYPAAFSNYALPELKLEQPRIHGTVKTSDCPVNVLPSRELSCSNGLAGYQGLRNQELQPFAIDMKQSQDVVFNEMQRRNGFGVATEMQQQAKGMSGINAVGREGIFVGGQYSNVSDPVAAIKMHYAKAAQLSMQGGISSKKMIDG